MIFEKSDELKDYKDKLDNLNNKADCMFEHMKGMSKMVNRKITQIEGQAIELEEIFNVEITSLISYKSELKRIQDRNFNQQH